MFKDAFIKLDLAAAHALTERLNRVIDVPFDPLETNVLVHPLPFYEGYMFAEFSRHNESPPVTAFAAYKEDGDMVALDWTNAPIYRLNKTAPLTLNSDNITAYIKFFFNHVRGSHGRFLIVENVDDIDWRDEPAAAGRKALAKMIEPVHFLRSEPDGTKVFGLSIIFKDSLFAAEAHVTPDGVISLHEEELLVEDIPVADDLFGQ
jgi:hypothetical protein